MRKYIITLLLAAVALPSAAQQAEQMLGIGTPSQPAQTPAELAATKGFAVGVSYEPGFIVSKVDYGDGEQTWKGGHGFVIDLWEVFGEGKGFGLNLSHSATHYDFPYTDKPLSLLYAGVSYVRVGALGKHWAFNWAIGAGYAHYAVDTNRNMHYAYNRDLKSSGVGIMLRAGIEYLPMKLLGIALDLRDTDHIFPSEDTPSEGLIPGFERWSLNLGLRFHF